MRLLVTGGAGYIGGVVARRLLDAGHEVTVLDNLSRGHRAGVPAGATFVEADILDTPAVERTLNEGFDAVLHFAAFALVSESVAHPERYWHNNLAGSLSLLGAMRSTGVRRLVFSSTCATYGEPETVPISEDEPADPVNPYGWSKLAVDRMIADETRAHGLGAVSLRYFNVAGASGEQGEDHDPETHIVPNVLRVAAGRQNHVELYGTDYPTPDGSAIRDYIHVEDLADAHGLALEHTPPGTHTILNLGNGTGFSVREVIAAARTVTGHAIPVEEHPRRPGDPPRLVAASQRIRDVLGWEARKPAMETMIADAWAWHQAHPDGYAQP